MWHVRTISRERLRNKSSFSCNIIQINCTGPTPGRRPLYSGCLVDAPRLFIKKKLRDKKK
jgi:hypothetical protein